MDARGNSRSCQGTQEARHGLHGRLDRRPRPEKKIRSAAGYQVPFAEKVKKESGITTMTGRSNRRLPTSGRYRCFRARRILFASRAQRSGIRAGPGTRQKNWAPKHLMRRRLWPGIPKLRPQLFPKRAQAAGLSHHLPLGEVDSAEVGCFRLWHLLCRVLPHVPTNHLPSSA